MNLEEIEARLAEFRTPEPDPGLRVRTLACAGAEWVRRARARLIFRRFVRGWAVAVAAAVLICAAIGWREESLTARCFASRPAEVDRFERALRSVCAEVGLNDGYAARWALLQRERRGQEAVAARLWREMVIQ
jgi:hypothetical protein